MSDDKIDDIRREHFGVSDDEMGESERYKRDTPPDDLGEHEQYGPLTRGMLKRCIMPTGEQMQEMYDYAERSIKDHLIINPSAPFTEEMSEQLVKALHEAETHNAPVFYVDMKGTTLLDDEDMSYSEYVSEALPPYRRLEPKPGCYKDVEATEPCTEPGDPVGAVVYEGETLTQKDEAKRPTFTGKVTLDLEGTPFEGSDMDGAEVGTSITECFGCGMPVQRSGLFAEADVRCNECADKHQQQREKQRMQLVDGWPGDWQWVDSEIGEWRLVVADSYTTVTASVFKDTWPNRGDWAGAIEVREPVQPHAHCILESQVYSDTPYDVARKLRPHGEALAACLGGMRNE